MKHRASTGSRAKEVVSMIDWLREEEGESVTILCPNPEAESADQQTGVEVVGEWTGWKPRRFMADNWTVALRDAFEAMLHSTGKSL